VAHFPLFSTFPGSIFSGPDLLETTTGSEDRPLGFFDDLQKVSMAPWIGTGYRRAAGAHGAQASVWGI